MSEPSIRAGCEPFALEGGPVGIVMVHGFTGSPASMRPMGEWFAEQGLCVEGVRLPGHGTSVEDLRRRPWTEWFDEILAARAELPRVQTAALVFEPGEDHTIPRSNPPRSTRRSGRSGRS